MKGGATKKLEDTVSALDKKQLKKALYLTDREGMESQHSLVKEAARTCIADKGKACELAMKEAREKIQDAITPPLEETSLEGLEEYLGESKEKPAESTGQTDEELYEECEPCHVANAVAQFDDIHHEHPSEVSQKLIEDKIGQYVEPESWIKNMIEVTEQTEGEAKKLYGLSLKELTDYLERRDSPILKKLDEQPSE